MDALRMTQAARENEEGRRHDSTVEEHTQNARKN